MKKLLFAAILAVGAMTAYAVAQEPCNSPEYCNEPATCDTVPCYKTPCDTVPCNPAPCEPAPCFQGC